MSILLKKVQRINPSDKKAAKKWYPVQQTIEQLDESEVAKLIADETTLNASEALMAIRQLRKVVERALLDSKSVKLGDWGNFNLSLSTTGTDNKADLKADAVKGVRINFRPGTELRTALQQASYVWIEELMGENSSTSSDSTTEESSSTETGGGTESNPL